MAGSEELNFAALSLIFEIINYHDAELNDLFQQIESAHCLSFAVSWILTMFAHEIKQISVIARVYDYCLAAFASNEFVSIYLAAALLLYFKKDLLHNVKAMPCKICTCFLPKLSGKRSILIRSSSLLRTCLN